MVDSQLTLTRAIVTNYRGRHSLLSKRITRP
jgi:hypothetical protein